MTAEWTEILAAGEGEGFARRRWTKHGRRSGEPPTGRKFPCRGALSPPTSQTWRRRLAGFLMFSHMPKHVAVGSGDGDSASLPLPRPAPRGRSPVGRWCSWRIRRMAHVTFTCCEGGSEGEKERKYARTCACHRSVAIRPKLGLWCLRVPTVTSARVGTCASCLLSISLSRSLALFCFGICPWIPIDLSIPYQCDSSCSPLNHENGIHM